MAGDSRADREVTEQLAVEPDGLNVTSEILKEDEECENSWNSFFEDSIDRRAAKALKVASVRELLSEGTNKKERKSRSRARNKAVDSLVKVIYSSMTTDMRRAAFSASPSPNRINRRESCGSYSVYSTSGTFSSPVSHLSSTPQLDNKPTQAEPLETAIPNPSTQAEGIEQSKDNLLHFTNDDSIASEPELDLAFNQSQQTMDILSAAGNLYERRGVHGGYGTPSSYTSEQEMKMYFGSTPIPDAEPGSFVIESGDEAENRGNEDISLKVITQLDDKMKIEILSEETPRALGNCNSTTRENRNEIPNDELHFWENRNKTKSLTAAATRCEDVVKQLEAFASSSNASHKLDGLFDEEDGKSVCRSGKKVTGRKIANGHPTDVINSPLKIQKKKKASSKSTLRKMLKRLSDSHIDGEVSSAMLLNLTTPDPSTLPTSSDDLAPFDFFQECLKEYRSHDTDENTTSNNVSSDELTSNREQSPDPVDFRRSSSDQSFDEEILNVSLEINGSKSFINESIAQTYQSPLFQQSDLNSSDENVCDQLTYDQKSHSESISSCDERNDRDHLSLDLSGINDQENGYASDPEVESNRFGSESPIYFERDNERADDVCTARKQLNFNQQIASCNDDNGIGIEDDEPESQTFVLNSETKKEKPQDQTNEAVSLDKPKQIEQIEEITSTNGYCQFLHSSSSEPVHAAEEHSTASCGKESRTEIIMDAEMIHKFAHNLVSEVISDLCSPEKGFDPALCCDSESESGYCTTNESRFKSNLTQIPASDCDKLVNISNIREPLDDAKDCGCIEKNDDEIQNQEVKKDLAASFMVQSCQVAEEKSEDRKVPGQSFEPSVFAVKASVLESRIKSFEDYTAQARSSITEQADLVREEEIHSEERKVLENNIISVEMENNHGRSSQVKEDEEEVSLKASEPASVLTEAKKSNLDNKESCDASAVVVEIVDDCSINSGVNNPRSASNVDGEEVHECHSQVNWPDDSDTPKETSYYITTSSAQRLDNFPENRNIPKIYVTSASLEDDESNDPNKDTTCTNASEAPSRTTESEIKQGIERENNFKNDPISKENGQHNVENEISIKNAASSLPPKRDQILSQIETTSSKAKTSSEGKTVLERRNLVGDVLNLQASQGDNVASPSSESCLEQFTVNFKCKYKNLDEQIDRILNPSPSPPPAVANERHVDCLVMNGENQRRTPSKKVRFDERVGGNEWKENVDNVIHVYECSPLTRSKKKSTASPENFHSPPRYRSCHYNNLQRQQADAKYQKYPTAEQHNDDFDSISQALQFVKSSLNRDDECVKILEENIRRSYHRILSMDDESPLTSFRDDEGMSNTRPNREEKDGPTKVRALEEVVGLLKKHIQQRESEINGLGHELRQSNEKIKRLEKRLKDKTSEHFSSSYDDRHDLTRELQSIEKERDFIQDRLSERINEKEKAQVATRRARRDLDYEKEKNRTPLRSNRVVDSRTQKVSNNKQKELRGRVGDLEFLSKSANSEFENGELDLDSIGRENRSNRAQNEEALVELKTDNLIMREKLDRMNEISAENLRFQSEKADYQAELSDLRTEAKRLRTKCYELTEENRQCNAEIRDLRRYIELLKANKTGDTRQDLLSKIEYYQMEHDRLMDEVRRLKHRLGEVSPRPHSPPPRSPRQRASSPKPHSSYPGPSNKRTSPPTVKFASSLERGRSPVADAIAASTASSLAGNRLIKDRSLSPSAALSFRDLTMDRYNHHMDRPESPHSIDSDCTELLLKPQANSRVSPIPRSNAPILSDDEFDDDVDITRHRSAPKLSDSYGSSQAGYRSACRDDIGSSPCKRSCSPSYPGGFRSVSPKMTSTQNGIPDTARDRYPTKIKKSLPRRAFAPRSPADLKLGYCIKFTRPGGRLSRGTVKYIGHLPTRNEIFIGVELDGHDGKHSGTFQGTKYFSCPTNKGIFTPFSKVIMAWE